jgi:copper(I)-binding protein
MKALTGLGLAGLALLGCRGESRGASATLGEIRIDHGFAYEPITPASGAAYFRIRNDGSAADTVLEASSPVARMAAFHASGMAHLVALAIPAGGAVELKPGATHLMLTEFSAPPKAGDSLTVTLRFAHAGTITLRLPVRRYGQ